MPSRSDRYARQAEIIPSTTLSGITASIIGVGAIGRQVALQLAAIGVPHLQLVDFDRVELTNLASQGFSQDELGQSKVAATATAIARIDPLIQLELVIDRYRPTINLSQIVFCCVDSIETRAAIWRTAGPRCAFCADGRMRAETLRILAVSDPGSRAYYSSTLFGSAEAQRGSCTAKTTIYAASIAAGLMVHLFTRWLRGLPVDRDLAVNLLASEMSALDR